jgi:replicative DNA helicase
MAALPYRVLSEIVRAKDMATPQRLGLDQVHFKSDPEAGQIYDFIKTHYNDPRTYRQLPLIRSIKKRWPAFEMTSKSDKGRLATLIQELKHETYGSDARSLAAYFQELVEDDPEKAIRVMQQEIADLRYHQEASGGFGMREIANEVRGLYEKAASGQNFGIPWPWDPLTYDTLGKSPGDFHVFYGRQKSMKTWLELFSAVEDFSIHNRRVMFWSKEMLPAKLIPRFASILGGVDYQELKHGRLPKPILRRFYESLDKLGAMVGRSKEELAEGAQHDVPDLVILCGRDAPKTVEELAVAVQIYKPEIVYLDSFHHLTSARSIKYKQRNEQLLYIAEDVKNFAMDMGVPVVGAWHANREGEKSAGETTADVAGTDALSREVDGMYRILYRKGPMMFEDEYEGYWAKKDKKADLTEKRHSALLKIPISKKAEKAAEKGPSIAARMAAAKTGDKAEDKERGRKSAEIAIIPSANREGVLEGMLVHVVPGYKNKVLRDDFTSKEAKEWMRKDEDSGGTTAGKKRNGPNGPALGAGEGFGSLPRR